MTYEGILATTWGIDTVAQAFMFGLTIATVILAFFLPLVMLIVAGELLGAYLDEKFDRVKEEEVEEE